MKTLSENTQFAKDCIDVRDSKIKLITETIWIY